MRGAFVLLALLALGVVEPFDAEAVDSRHGRPVVIDADQDDVVAGDGLRGQWSAAAADFHERSPT